MLVGEAMSTRNVTLMQRALELAKRGRGQVSPNPLVGCVIVSAKGEIIGEGWHERFGGPHAEPNAIADAEAKGASVEGATVYVTLEPHSHQGKTQPCSELLIRKGIARCVIAMQDPYVGTNGEGIRQLNTAGIKVEVGLLEAEARELNRFFIKYVTEGTPYVTLKLASSIDGRSALASGESRWITSEASRKMVHELRAGHDAVLIGTATAAADDPALTVRLAEGRQPIRIVLDAGLSLPGSLKLFTDEHKELTLVATSSRASATRKDELRADGIQLLESESDGSAIALASLLTQLGSHGIASILVEAGPTLAASFLKANLVDEISVFMSPLMLGADARPSVGPLNFHHLADATRYALYRAEQVAGSDDILVRLRPRRS